jgi:hypothetical protein
MKRHTCTSVRADYEKKLTATLVNLNQYSAHMGMLVILNLADIIKIYIFQH